MTKELRSVPTPPASAALPRLRPGARVAVVAPSSPIRPDMLAAGLRELAALGLAASAREDAGARHLFFAGDDARRLDELQASLDDASVEAVFAARGGYGLTPLLGRLHAPSRRPWPVILGESDTTALGCWALAHGSGWLHGPMVAGSLRQGSAGYDAPSLRAALFDDAGRLEPAGTRTLAEGEATGVAWGGCLTLLASLCGTPWLPRLGPSILVVEDVGVKPYQVHRMLVQLRDAGALRDVRGVVLGDFSDCVQHADQGYDVADVMRDFLLETLGPVPVTIGWPIGHAAAPHVTIPMGVPARLVARGGEAAILTWRRTAATEIP